jgi:hypothetical protein
VSNIIFPVLKSSNWKMTRTPQFKTLIQTSASGLRTRAALQSAPIWKWTLKNGVLQAAPTIADLQAIESLFNSMYGMYDSFLWRDPEFESLIPGYDTYYSVAFLTDALDFDRFAHELWELGTMSFQQVDQQPILLPPATTGSGSGSSQPILTADLAVITNFTNSTGAPAIPTISSSLGGIFGGTTLDVRGTYSTQTDSITYTGPTAAGLRGMTVTAVIGGTLFSDATPTTLNVFDVTLTVNFADGSSTTVRPSHATVSSNATTGLVTNSANAIDSDTSTYATIVRSHFSGLSDPGYISFSGFSF